MNIQDFMQKYKAFCESREDGIYIADTVVDFFPADEVGHDLYLLVSAIDGIKEEREIEQHVEDGQGSFRLAEDDRGTYIVIKNN